MYSNKRNSCNFDDPLSQNFHRFAILYMTLDTPSENPDLLTITNDGFELHLWLHSGILVSAFIFCEEICSGGS